MQSMRLLTMLSCVAAVAGLRFKAAAPACSGYEATISKNKFPCDVDRCRLAHSSILDPSPATTFALYACIQKATNVSVPCSICFGKVAQCSFEHCAIPCLTPSMSDECDACSHKASGAL